ncbi:MAG: hypothetical protein JW818_11740 [Pirellulales bacterium]|nr:hypothetical protein [Pirellulales bacterium]
MRTSLGDTRSSAVRPFWSTGRLWAVFFLAALVVLPGCGGCQGDPQTEAEKEAKRRAEELEKQKPEFSPELLTSVPYEPRRSSENKEQEEAQSYQRGCWYKPGHWTSVVFPLTANKADVLADLDIDLIGQSPLATKTEHPVSLQGVAYTLTQCREASLPKGQPKSILTALYVPNWSEVVKGKIHLAARRGSATSLDLPATLRRMNSYRYHLVVLSRTPNRYVFLRAIHSIKPPMNMVDSQVDSQQAEYYHVYLLKASSPVAVPAAAMHWTSIAYVVWDEADPKTLSVDQRQALVDWLHWGGQLILSGPGTLDTLRDSFLTDYLPATAEKAQELPSDAFRAMSDRFTPPGWKPLAVEKPMGGVQLKLARGGQFVPGTGKLLAERRVGRGRIVVSAMPLSDRTLVGWDGYDNFFNACLLRRPARHYWSEGENNENNHVDWADRRSPPLDAALTCSLRYFTRDTGISFNDYSHATPSPNAEEPAWMAGGPGGSTADEGLKFDGPGVAAWRDFGPVPDSAREILHNAASVRVPGKSFVLWIAAVYLVVLVPLNWMVFWALGRVEWAWVAAPVIAIVCTFMVVRLAQLDIGFARSETDVGVLELQSDYPRAHLTRYTALYTSLTTDYAFRHEEPGVLVQPFPKVDNPDDFRLGHGQDLRTLRYQHDKERGMDGFRVASNTVDFVHSEQMVELDGPIGLLQRSRNDWSLNNRTGIPMHGVGVIRRNESNEIETAWVGDLGERGIIQLKFQSGTMENSTWWPDQRDRSDTTSALAVKGRCNLWLLLGLAEKVHDLRPGEVRLVGWTDREFEDLSVSPESPQSQRAYLVVAHLRRVLPAAPQPDVKYIKFRSE